MSLLVLQAKNKCLSDPVKSEKMSLKQWDIVEVFRDDWLFGRLDYLPDFWIVRLQGVSVRDSKQYSDSVESNILDSAGHPVMRHKRKYQLILSNYLTELEMKNIIKSTIIRIPNVTVGMITSKI